MGPEDVAPAPRLFLPRYCYANFRNRNTCTWGSISQGCAIEQHCSQSCFPHPFVGVTPEGTFKAAIITKSTFMVLLLRALTNTSSRESVSQSIFLVKPDPRKQARGKGLPGRGDSMSSLGSVSQHAMCQ